MNRRQDLQQKRRGDESADQVVDREALNLSRYCRPPRGTEDCCSTKPLSSLQSENATRAKARNRGYVDVPDGPRTGAAIKVYLSHTKTFSAL
jgi:hypothetical protein